MKIGSQKWRDAIRDTPLASSPEDAKIRMRIAEGMAAPVPPPGVAQMFEGEAPVITMARRVCDARAAVEEAHRQTNHAAAVELDLRDQLATAEGDLAMAIDNIGDPI